MTQRIIEEREEEYRGDPRYVAPVRRGSRWRRNVQVREYRRPGAGSIIFGLLIAALIGAGVYYYYYGHRSLNNDISELRSTSADAATTAAVKTAFTLNKQLKDDSISVDTNKGVVTLTGQVNNQTDHDTAEQTARSTRGVEQVVNNLSITPAAQQQQQVQQLQNDNSKLQEQTKDLQLQNQVLQTLLATDALKGQDITASVANGLVTLTGTVDTPQMKDIAIASAQHVAGVTRVEAQNLNVRTAQPTQPAEPAQ